MIERVLHQRRIARLLDSFPVVVLLGSRQAGKTTLALSLAEQWDGEAEVFDLESPADLAALADPMLALEARRGLVVIDEVQLRPQILGTLRVLADRPHRPAQFLLLGSASPRLIRGSAESLAGRAAFYELPGLTADEVGISRLDRLWLRGGLPSSFTARTRGGSYEWRANFVRAVLERDIPQLGISLPSRRLDRFWSMLAHYHMQVWNSSELARGLGVSHHTVRRYLETLESLFLVRTLKPWSANIKKRQVKVPKVYIRDSGILHYLLDLPTMRDLERHPKVGASWEGFVVEWLIQRLGVEERRCFHWRAHTGAEIDLVIQQGATLRGFEVKRSSAPRLTRSMRTALSDLDLTRIDVIHAGRRSFPLAERIRAVSVHDLPEEL